MLRTRVRASPIQVMDLAGEPEVLSQEAAVLGRQEPVITFSLSLTPTSPLSISAPSPAFLPQGLAPASGSSPVAPTYQGHSCVLPRDVQSWFAVLALPWSIAPDTLSLHSLSVQ